MFYWRAVKACLPEHIEPFEELRDSFWPSTRVKVAEEDELDDDGKVCEEFVEDDVFVEQRRDHPFPCGL